MYVQSLTPLHLMVGDVVEFDYAKQERRGSRWGGAFGNYRTPEYTGVVTTERRTVTIAEVAVCRDGIEDEAKFSGSDEARGGDFRCFFYDRCSNVVITTQEAFVVPVAFATEQAAKVFVGIGI